MTRLRPRRLGPIALALSGGGYRAAAFHLGTLDVLHRLDLLTDVTVLSTVSGGTFTGCGYALACARGRPFSEFFRGLYAFLSEVNVVAQAVASLGRGRARSLSQRRTLSGAAAEVYTDPRFVGDATFGELLDARLHLRELSFNATDLRTGIAFRFQRSRSSGRIGNRYASIPRDVARHLRLADIVAASSCFPGAFEPLSFPEDFVWPAAALDANGRPARVPIRQLPLMDGGIYDNQGTQCLLLAASRLRGSGFEPRLFVISDTRQRKPALFAFQPVGPPGRLTLAGAIWIGRILTVACGLSALALGLRLINAVSQDRVSWGELFTLSLPFALTTIITIAVPLFWWLVRRQAARRFPGDASALWRGLAHLRLQALAELVDLRLRSLFALTSDVFLERIRSQGYKRLYQDPERCDRIVSNLVYTLDSAEAPEPWLVPSVSQRQIARRAAETPTALSFDNPEQLRDLVGTGQSTICYGLLRHLLGRHGPDPAAYTPEVRRLFGLAQELWFRLQDNDSALLEEYVSNGGLPARPGPIP